MTTLLQHRDGQDLVTRFRGQLITPEDLRYDNVRRVYNGMIDKRPALIAQCHDVADVIAAVNFGRESGRDVAVRGGAHNGAGLGTTDGGLVIDLRAMNGVIVDPGRRLATVQGGALIGDLDHATHAFGLATPAGVISTTGVGGLTLGGGHGYLSRKFGLTIDNLVSANIVLADGSFVSASEGQEADLFWALRGGGGNFGVVTSFTLRLHPVSMVFAGPTLWPIEDAASVLRWYREFLPSAPDDVYGFFAFLRVPALASFPTALHGRMMCGVVWCCLGARDHVTHLATAVREPAAPALHDVEELPYPALQSAFDALYRAGYQWYWRGDFVRQLPDDAIERHVQFGRALPSPLSTMHLYPVDRAVHRVAADAAAFSYRDATWSMVIAGVDPDPTRADALRQWTVRYWEALHPYSQGGGYVNFMMDEGPARVQATYRDNYARLKVLKARYDPHNVFHVNQNVQP